MRLSFLVLFFALVSAPLYANPVIGPDENTRCEVCGMFISPYPNWVASLEMTDGRRFYFDGPKDLFIFYSDLTKYLPDATYEQVKDLFVTEYYTTQMVNAREVYFIAGSDVRGPMGMELVPVDGRDAAETFRRDHNGSKIMRFSGHELIEVEEQQ